MSRTIAAEILAAILSTTRVDRWDYQACTQVLQPLGTNNRSDMFPPHAWTESWMTEHCRRRFSVSPGFEFMKEQMGLGTDCLALH